MVSDDVPDRFNADTDPPPPDSEIDDTPTVTCDRCNSKWDLSYELDELKLGNTAIEQFAIDHKRHTGHYPDEITPWIVSCRQCPDGDEFLSERPARRWATTHTRHTRHTVTVDHFSKPNRDSTEPDDG